MAKLKTVIDSFPEDLQDAEAVIATDIEFYRCLVEATNSLVVSWVFNTFINAWESAVLDRAQAMNVFTDPLPYSEIKSTAKSVARWVWNKYWGKAESDRRWRAKQAARGRMKGARNRRVGIHMLKQGYSIKEITNTLGVNRTTVWRWRNVAKP